MTPFFPSLRHTQEKCNVRGGKTENRLTLVSSEHSVQGLLEAHGAAVHPAGPALRRQQRAVRHLSEGAGRSADPPVLKTCHPSIRYLKDKIGVILEVPIT